METKHVGWSAVEIIWLEAALTLPPPAFFAACDDIAEMTRRTPASVVQKALSIQRRNAVAVAVKVGAQASAIRKLTPQELMTGRASRRTASAP